MRNPMKTRVLGPLVATSVLVLWLLYFGVATPRCQEAAEQGIPAVPPDPASEPADESVATMFPHAEWDRWWLSGQANFISHWHPRFFSPYTGAYSVYTR